MISLPTTHWEPIVFRRSSDQGLVEPKVEVSDPSELSEVEVLLYVENSMCSELLAEGLADRGIASIVVRTPLDAIVLLQDEVTKTSAVLVSLQNTGNSPWEFLKFVRDQHPEVETAVAAWHAGEDGAAFVWAESANGTSAQSPTAPRTTPKLFSTERRQLRIATRSKSISCDWT